MNKSAILIFSVILLSGCSTLNKSNVNTEHGEPVKVIVTFTDIANDKGNLLIFIHDNEYSYYNDGNLNDNSTEFFQSLTVPATPPSTQVTFNNIPAGKYAISAFHDEDEDRRLDRMIFPFIGMPSEGYGISNGAFNYFSKGDFEDALIDLKSPEINLFINMSTHLNKIIGK